jgi:Predicted membrane protein
MIIYLAIMNVFAFCLYGFDKQKARKGQFRIAEKYLLFVASLGGATGAFIGMRLFRHKTKKKKFTILIPLFMLVQWILYAYIENIYM